MANSQDFSLPDGWNLLTAYQVDGNGLVGTVGSTDSRQYQCTLYPKGRGPIAATGSTPKEAIANAELKAVGKDEADG